MVKHFTDKSSIFGYNITNVKSEIDKATIQFDFNNIKYRLVIYRMTRGNIVKIYAAVFANYGMLKISDELYTKLMGYIHYKSKIEYGPKNDEPYDLSSSYDKIPIFDFVDYFQIYTIHEIYFSIMKRMIHRTFSSNKTLMKVTDDEGKVNIPTLSTQFYITKKNNNQITVQINLNYTIVNQPIVRSVEDVEVQAVGGTLNPTIAFNLNECTLNSINKFKIHKFD